ncbi:hypothetical protein AB0K40_29730 [Nonomuraea bangladeshensis]|uniref:Uncharacterized protein n=1 Tax=Nonomuraea bangladeshensis TaxID=404385 RepID=A0ABV3HB19_9ACTN
MRKFQPQPGFVVQAYRFALGPNVTQEAPAARPVPGGQVAQSCRTVGRRKRETVIRTPERELRAPVTPLRTFPPEKSGLLIFDYGISNGQTLRQPGIQAPSSTT